MLRKKEVVYRNILERYFKGHETRFTQLELSRRFGFSLSTVSNALAPLRSMGAITVKHNGFELSDPKKALLYFATVRSLEKDIIYSTRLEAPPREIERLVPSGAVFTAYSAFRLIYKDAPADYSEVYIYLPGSGLGEAKKRFPPSSRPPNIFVLEADPFIGKNAVSAPHLFADLWNIRSWYAKEFLEALEMRLFP